MLNINHQLLILISFSLLVVGCNSNIKLAKTDPNTISIFNFNKNNSENSNLYSQPISLPIITPNIIWPNSGNQVELIENLQLADQLVENKYKLFNNHNTEFLTANPVISEDKLFVINNAQVYAYDKLNLKKLLWKKDLSSLGERKDNIGGGIAYKKSKLYLSAGHKEVVALNSTNGKEIWRQALNNIIRSAPVIYQNQLFIITIDNKLYSLDLESGNINWLYEGSSESISIFGAASLAIKEDTVVVPQGSGQLMAFDTKNGQELWSLNLNYNSGLSDLSFGDIDVIPKIDHKNHLYTASSLGGSLYAIDLINGHLSWQQSIKGIRSIWLANEFLYVINDNNQLLCLMTQNGNIKYTTQLPVENQQKKSKKLFLSGPMLANNKLLVVSNDGRLFNISPFDGSIISQTSVATNINMLPIVAENKLYLLNDNGLLSVLK